MMLTQPTYTINIKKSIPTTYTLLEDIHKQTPRVKQNTYDELLYLLTVSQYKYIGNLIELTKSNNLLDMASKNGMTELFVIRSLEYLKESGLLYTANFYNDYKQRKELIDL